MRNIKYTKDVLYREKHKYAKAKIYPRKKNKKKDLFQETKTIQMIIIEESDKTHNYQKHCELIHMHYLKDSREIFQETNY